jgi:hypothetical protein
MTVPERENRDSNHELRTLRCGSCATTWLCRAGQLFLANEDRCLRCGGPLEARD